MNHTPGPWNHVPEDNLIMTYAGRHVAEFQPRSTHVSVAERDANGRLISAAPDLLAAVEAAYLRLLTIGDYPSRHTAEGQGELVALREAIAKAKGVEPQEVQDTAESIGLQRRLGKLE